MTKIFCFSFLLMACFVSCMVKKRRQIVFEGGGTFIQPIDSSAGVVTWIVKFDNSVGVVFPASFGKKLFGADRSKSLTFFDPDTALIRKIDKEIDYQYCNVSEKHNERYWGKVLHTQMADSLKPILTVSQKELIDRISLEQCTYWQENRQFYDKQYICYITPTGEKIVRVKLIDFRQDPHHLKQYLKTSWIEGWHGWFYSNLHEVYFHINNNRLTITEDL